MVSFIFRFLPVTRWLREYTKPKAVSDIIAGLTVGLTVLPQGLAYATLAGLEPQYGLYSAFMGCFVYAIMGGIRELTIGPTALLALMTAQHTSHWSGEQLAVLLCFLAGCVQALMALFRMGALVDLISLPVTVGFTSATAVIIATSQVKGLFGIRSLGGRNNSFSSTIVGIFNNLPNSQLGDCLLGAISIIILLILKKIKDVGAPPNSSKWRKTFGGFLWVIGTARNALVVLCGALLAYTFERHSNSVPFVVTGTVRSGLPPLAAPSFSMSRDYCNITTNTNNEHSKNISLTSEILYKTCSYLSQNITTSNFSKIIETPGQQVMSFGDMIEELGSSIILVPIIAVLGNVAISKAFGGSNLNPSRELLALSLSNIFGSFVSSMPVTGSFSRSAVNHASGVQTPLGGIWTGLLVLLALGVLTPYFHYIPKASLSSVIICAVVFMIEYEVVKPLWRCSRRELFTCLMTFIVSLGYSVEAGLLCGVVLDLLYVVYKAARPEMPVLNFATPSGFEYLVVKPGHSLLYFPAVEFVRGAVSKAASEKELPIVIDCSLLNDVDFTAARALGALSKELKGRLILLKPHDRILTLIEGAHDIKHLLKTVHNEDQLFEIIEDLYSQQKQMELKDVISPLLTPEDRTYQELNECFK